MRLIQKRFFESNHEGNTTLRERAPKVESDASKKARFANLLGKTIEPKTAGELLAQFSFDHTGKVLGAKRKITTESLDKLERATLARGLGQTNSTGERSAPRTEREVLLDIAYTLNKAKAESGPALQAKIDQSLAIVKNQWFSFSAVSPGTPGVNPTEKLLKQIAADFSADLPEVGNHALTLAAEALKTKTVAQAYDNTFGRKFESEFVFSLTKNTPESVKQAASATNKWLLDQVTKLPPTAQAGFIKNLADNLSHDPRPWHAETPDVAQFLAQPTIETLKELLKPDALSGFDVIKTSWIGVKAALSFPAGFQPAFKALADDNYGKVVTAARSQVNTVSGGGLKLQSQAANVIIGELNVIFSARARLPNNTVNAQVQQDYVRSLLDPISYSVRTPRELSKILFEFEKDLRSKNDPQIADVLLKHANFLAANPEPDREFAVIEAPTDDVDKRRAAQKGLEVKQFQTSGYGTSLPHQRVNVGGDNWGSGFAVPTKSTLNMDQIKDFDKNTLENEMNSVNGPSGSTNIMAFMYLQIKSENPSLNLEDAFAGTMMFLTLDGGHSLPESVGTFNSIRSDTRDTLLNNLPTAEAAQIASNRTGVLSNFRLDYGKLSDVFTNPETSGAVRASLEAAWDKTLGSFTSIHEERVGTAE